MRDGQRLPAPRAGHPNAALTSVSLVPIARQNSPRGLCKRASTEVEDTRKPKLFTREDERKDGQVRVMSTFKTIEERR